MFIRKYKQIDGATEPYIYIGKGNTVYFEGVKPITVKIELEHEVPASLYNEFTIRVYKIVFSDEEATEKVANLNKIKINPQNNTIFSIFCGD